MVLPAVISALAQLLAFSAIPFIVYLITTRSWRGFLRYIGLYAAPTRALLLAALVAIVFGGITLLVFSTPEIRPVVTAPDTVPGTLRKMGLSAATIIALVIGATIKTALAEEILFRGFIAKRLIDWLGFQWGNILQALIFGAVHLALFLSPSAPPLTPLRGTVILLPITLVAWITVYINERLANGSFLPGWVRHGL
jgi:membrane protease YdiL (CAAX protease family)